jgi:hypothetical protein
MEEWKDGGKEGWKDGRMKLPFFLSSFLPFFPFFPPCRFPALIPFSQMGNRKPKSVLEGVGRRRFVK